MPIHKNYLLLTPEEKYFVDEMFREAFRFNIAIGWAKLPLDNSDGVERAVEAVATWVIESRPKAQQNITGNGFTDAAGNAIVPFHSNAYEDYNRDLDNEL